MFSQIGVLNPVFIKLTNVKEQNIQFFIQEEHSASAKKWKIKNK